jgi:hypothetical protein
MLVAPPKGGPRLFGSIGGISTRLVPVGKRVLIRTERISAMAINEAAPPMKRQWIAGGCFYFKSSVLMLMESATSHDIGSKVARAEHARICGTASGFLVMASKSSRLFHWA